MAFPQLTNEEKIEFLKSAFHGSDKPFVKDGVALTDGSKPETLSPLEVNNIIGILMSGETL